MAGMQIISSDKALIMKPLDSLDAKLHNEGNRADPKAILEGLIGNLADNPHGKDDDRHMTLLLSTLQAPEYSKRVDMRAALQDLSLRHGMVTQNGFENAISTAEAIRQLIASNPFEKGQSPNLGASRHTITTEILGTTNMSNAGRDNDLFAKFKKI